MPPDSEKSSDDRDTGLPGLRTWRGVYWLVIAVFAAVVVALTIFSRVFA